MRQWGAWEQNYELVIEKCLKPQILFHELNNELNPSEPPLMLSVCDVKSLRQTNGHK